MTVSELQQTIAEIDADVRALHLIELEDIKGLVIRSGDGETDRIISIRGIEGKALRAVTYAALREARRQAESQLKAQQK
jgi:hypothetical protein